MNICCETWIITGGGIWIITGGELDKRQQHASFKCNALQKLKTMTFGTTNTKMLT